MTPILLALALTAALPESIGFLVASGAPSVRIAGLLRRMFPDQTVPAGTRFRLAERKLPGLPVRHMFAGRRGVGTVLLIAAAVIGARWDAVSLYEALGAPGIVAAIFVVLLGISQHGDATVHE